MLPHYVLLAFLWAAYVVLTVALVAILVTGRCPRPIFDFNVGVLRWSWRVAYYAYGGLGTTAIRRSAWTRVRTTRPTWTWSTASGCPGDSRS